MSETMRGTGVRLLVAAAVVAQLGCITTRERVVEERPYREPAQETYAPPAPPVAASVNEWDAELSPYGTWVISAQHGRVWRPDLAVVGASWRPYTYGHWEMTEYGWTWMDDNAWSYAVHHYGRWAWDPAYGWVWMPDTVWGPAWVSWRTGGSCVGWAPMAPGYSAGMNVTISDGAWSFTETRYINSDGLYRNMLWGDAYRGCLHNTVVYHDVRTYHGGRYHYDYGPPTSYVHNGGGNVRPVRVTDLDSTRPVFRPTPGRGHGSTGSTSHGPSTVGGSPRPGPSPGQGNPPPANGHGPSNVGNQPPPAGGGHGPANPGNPPAGGGHGPSDPGNTTPPPAGGHGPANPGNQPPPSENSHGGPSTGGTPPAGGGHGGTQPGEPGGHGGSQPGNTSPGREWNPPPERGNAPSGHGGSAPGGNAPSQGGREWNPPPERGNAPSGQGGSTPGSNAPAQGGREWNPPPERGNAPSGHGGSAPGGTNNPPPAGSGWNPPPERNWNPAPAQGNGGNPPPSGGHGWTTPGNTTPHQVDQARPQIGVPEVHDRLEDPRIPRGSPPGQNAHQSPAYAPPAARPAPSYTPPPSRPAPSYTPPPSRPAPSYTPPPSRPAPAPSHQAAPAPSHQAPAAPPPPPAKPKQNTPVKKK